MMPPKAASTQVIEVIVPFKKADTQVMPVMSINFPETQKEALVEISFCLCNLR